MGHLLGLFDRPWLGIRPTGRLAMLRFAEFHRVADGRIQETAQFVDIPHLMAQAGQDPFPHATGAHLVQPGPLTHDGLLWEPQDPDEGRETLRTGDGRPLPPTLKQRIGRELDRLELLLEQIRTVEAQRDALLAAEAAAPHPSPAVLQRLKGVGPEAAMTLWSEGFFRHFGNRRQLAAFAGLAPTPWQSGTVSREQGVSKSGNARIRTTMVQLSWLWLQHQPASALSLWFRRRVAEAGGRGKLILIVALARKLVVSLWRFATAGVIPESAILSAS